MARISEDEKHRRAGKYLSMYSSGATMVNGHLPGCGALRPKRPCNCGRADARDGYGRKRR